MNSSTQYLVFIILGCITISTIVSSQQIEILAETSHPRGQGTLFTTDFFSSTSIFRAGKKLCATGLWALFTLPNYGAGSISNVVVYTVTGGNSFVCTGPNSVAHVLSKIQSFRRIAPYNVGGIELANPIEYCTKKYFLRSGSQDCKQVTANNLMLERDTPTIQSFGVSRRGIYRVCNDAARLNCYCLDVDNNGPYIVPDLNVWPSAAAPFRQLTQFILDDEPDECRLLPRP